MNVLADKQKLLYEKSTDIAELKKLEAEFYDLYYKLRDADAKKWWSKLSFVIKYVYGEGLFYERKDKCFKI